VCCCVVHCGAACYRVAEFDDGQCVCCVVLLCGALWCSVLHL